MSGRIARVHFNLHKKLWTVRERVDGKWKVTRHYKYLVATPLRFFVSEKQRQTVLAKRCRSVHAWVEVELYYAGDERPDSATDLVASYNPYFCGEYYTRHDMQPIEWADWNYARVLFDYTDRYIHRLVRE